MTHFSVEWLSADSTGPEICPVVPLGQLVHSEQVPREVQRTLLRHSNPVPVKHGPPNLNKMSFLVAVSMRNWPVIFHSEQNAFIWSNLSYCQCDLLFAEGCSSWLYWTLCLLRFFYYVVGLLVTCPWQSGTDVINRF